MYMVYLVCLNLILRLILKRQSDQLSSLSFPLAVFFQLSFWFVFVPTINHKNILVTETFVMDANKRCPGLITNNFVIN